MDFRAIIRKLAVGCKVLEIGPSYNPITPRSDGFDCTVMDHADTSSIIKKYREWGIDTSKIETVDVVSTDVGYFSENGIKFDLIIASHLIEHTTDLIKFLKNCEAALNHKGMLALIVPDKRYCFDKFRPLSSISTVIDAHLLSRNRHLGAVYEVYANFVRNNDAMAWSKGEAEILEYLHTPHEGVEAFERVLASGDYYDVHEWVFVPSSFRLLIQDLNLLGYTTLQEDRFEHTTGYEFFVLLRKGVESNAPARNELVKSVQREELESNQEWQKLLQKCIELERKLSSHL